MEKIVESSYHYVLTIKEICEKFGIKEEIRFAIFPGKDKLLVYPKGENK